MPETEEFKRKYQFLVSELAANRLALDSADWRQKPSLERRHDSIKRMLFDLVKANNRKK